MKARQTGDGVFVKTLLPLALFVRACVLPALARGVVAFVDDRSRRLPWEAPIQNTTRRRRPWLAFFLVGAVALAAGAAGLVGWNSARADSAKARSAPASCDCEAPVEHPGRIPEDFVVLDRAEAENNDSVVVTQETAEEYDLAAIPDLADVAGELSFGALPEFETRPQGLSGLQETYGVEFASFRPLTGQALVQALQNGQIDAANIFSTDPAIVVNDFVVLEDTEKLFGSQNMVPLVRAEVADTVRDALDAVSAELTTERVTEMLRQTDVEQRNPEDVAAEFLEQAGL